MRKVSLAFSVIVFHLVAFQKARPQKDHRPIPKNLEIRVIHAGTIQFSSHYTYTIRADGRVSLEYQQRGLPRGRNISEVLGLKVKNAPPSPKPPKKKERLSREQLAKIVTAFETADFFAMNERYYGNPDATGLVMCINHAETKGLSITMNGRKKEVTFFLGCSYGDMPEFKRFTELLTLVSDLLKDVQVREAEQKSE